MTRAGQAPLKKSLDRAMRALDKAEQRIGNQQVLIVRLRSRGMNATHATRILDELKGARHLASERLGREEAARTAWLWLHLEPNLWIH